MNRRAFLTGVSTAAIAAVLPAPAPDLWFDGVPTYYDAFVPKPTWVYFNRRLWALTGTQTIQFSEMLPDDWEDRCARHVAP